MKTTQHTAKGISQSAQLEISKNINQSFADDNAKFKAFDPEMDMTYSAKISAKIAEVEGISPDYVMVALQMQATQKVIQYSNAALSCIKTVKYYVEKTFPDDYLHLHEFGFTELKKLMYSQSRLILFLKSFAITLAKYKDDMIPKGLSQTTIDEILQLTTDLDKANINQEQAKKARFQATGKRVKAYNELWELVGKVAKAGKIIFENDTDLQRSYILDVSSKKKTVKIAEKEINSAVFQGKVIDSESKAAIEDAIVEIVGTNYSATTEEDGGFYRDEVIPGSYTVKITAVGYKELLKTGIVLSSDNENQEFSFAMDKIVLDAS